MRIQLGEGKIAIAIGCIDDSKSPNCIAFSRRDVRQLSYDGDVALTNDEINQNLIGTIAFSNKESIGILIEQLQTLEKNYK